MMALSLLRITMGANHSQAFKRLQSLCKKRSKVKFPKAVNLQEKSSLQERLTPTQFRVTQEKGTERAFTGEFVKHKQPGTYGCVVCGQELFTSRTKYDSHSGWPSFYDVIDQGRVFLFEDTTDGLHRIEVVCSECGAHLGHVFDDGPKPTSTRYCVNSASLQFYLKPPKSTEENPNKKDFTSVHDQSKQREFETDQQASPTDVSHQTPDKLGLEFVPSFRDTSDSQSPPPSHDDEVDDYAPRVSEFKCSSRGCGP